ncbi:uncharacterized LabA/DUF88 family protein [Bradyrhizobium sp. LM2.7]
MSSFEKIALFIDGANLYATSKALGFDLDYRRLLSEFQGRGTLLRAFYYTTVIEDQEYSSIRPLIDWLDYNGYTVVTKLTKEFVDANTGRRKVKRSMDVDLAVSAMELAAHVHQIVLFSGDGDFRSLVESLQRRGVRVTVVSTLATQPPMVADELRRQADVFIDLAELKARVGRDLAERPGSREMRQPPQFLARAERSIEATGWNDPAGHPRSSNVEEHRLLRPLQIDRERIHDLVGALAALGDQRRTPHRLLDQVQHGIGGIRRFFVREIEPRVEPDIDAARDDPDVDMRRTSAARFVRDRARLDGLECHHPALEIRAGAAPAAKILVRPASGAVGRMVVAAGRVGLPDFEKHVA